MLVVVLVHPATLPRCLEHSRGSVCSWQGISRFRRQDCAKRHFSAPAISFSFGAVAPILCRWLHPWGACLPKVASMVPPAVPATRRCRLPIPSFHRFPPFVSQFRMQSLSVGFARLHTPWVFFFHCAGCACRSLHQRACPSLAARSTASANQTVCVHSLQDYWEGYKIFCYGYYSNSVRHAAEFRDTKLGVCLCRLPRSSHFPPGHAACASTLFFCSLIHTLHHLECRPTCVASA